MTDDNTTGDNLSQQAHDAAEAGFDTAVEFVKRQWRENPVVVVAAAAGLGLLVGLLLGRRR